MDGMHQLLLYAAQATMANKKLVWNVKREMVMV